MTPPPPTAWLMLAASLLVASGASAQGAEEKPRARALFDEGRAALAAGDLEHACATLRESGRLDPRVGTHLNLADCEERRGRLLAAHEEWRAAAALAEQARDDRAKIALERLDQVAARLVRLRVQLAANAPHGSSVTLERDGTAPMPLTLGSVTFVDPGSYRIIIRAPARRERQYLVRLAEGDDEALTVEPGVQLERPPSRRPPLPSNHEGSPGSLSPWQRGGMVMGAFGLATMGVGAALGVVAMNHHGEAKEHCDANNACDDDGLALERDGLRFAHASTGAFVGGGVLATAGLILVLAAPSDDEAAEGRVRIVVRAGQLHVRGEW
jgi:tetratricopeptide (TPR) repeat protein